MRYFLLFLIIFLSSEISAAQDTIPTAEEQVVQYDTNSLKTPLDLDNDTLEDYKNDRDFNYSPPEEADNWWTQFLDWLSNLWSKFWTWMGNLWHSFWELFLDDAEDSTLWAFVINVLPYIILALLIAFVVWLFFKLNPGAKLLQTKGKPGIFFSEDEEIIRTRDIKKLIEKALTKKEYRLAVRYYYLLILKQLTEAELIAYEFDKTNSDYFTEIASETINNGFRKATNLYDYIWYGNFTVTEDDFRKAQNTFNSLEKSIPKRQ